MALGIQSLGIGSAAMFFLAALPIFISLLLNPLFSSRKTLGVEFSLWTYVIGQTLPLLTGSMLLLGIVEVFVPLVRFPWLFFISYSHSLIDWPNRCLCASGQYHRYYRCRTGCTLISPCPSFRTQVWPEGIAPRRNLSDDNCCFDDGSFRYEGAI